MCPTDRRSRVCYFAVKILPERLDDLSVNHSAAPPSQIPTSSRFGRRADENEVEQPTVYGGDERGHTDYP